MTYTVLAYSYWASFHDTWMLTPRPLTIQTTAAIKGHKTYLTNNMGSLSPSEAVHQRNEMYCIVVSSYHTAALNLFFTP